MRWSITWESPKISGNGAELIMYQIDYWGAVVIVVSSIVWLFRKQNARGEERERGGVLLQQFKLATTFAFVLHTHNTHDAAAQSLSTGFLFDWSSSFFSHDDIIDSATGCDRSERIFRAFNCFNYRSFVFSRGVIGCDVIGSR